MYNEWREGKPLLRTQHVVLQKSAVTGTVGIDMRRMPVALASTVDIENAIGYRRAKRDIVVSIGIANNGCLSDLVAICAVDGKTLPPLTIDRRPEKVEVLLIRYQPLYITINSLLPGLFPGSNAGRYYWLGKRGCNDSLTHSLYGTVDIKHPLSRRKLIRNSSHWLRV